MATNTLTERNGQTNFNSQNGQVEVDCGSSPINLNYSLSSGLSLLAGSTLHFGWSFWSLYKIWYIDVKPETAPSRLYFDAVITMSAWFIGAIAGCMLAGYALHNSPIKQANYIGSLMLFASGILFVAGSDTSTALDIGRFLAGCCNGIIYIGVLKQIGDNTPPSYRGRVTTGISLFAAVGPFSSALTLALANRSEMGVISLDQKIGIATIGFALVAVVAARFLKYDSVVQLIDSGREREAIDMLIKLRKESNGDSLAIRNEFDELKAMVHEASADDKELPKHIFSGGNKPVLKLVIALKLLNMLASNSALYFVSVVFLGNEIGIQWSLALFSVLRICALRIPLYWIDYIGRRYLLLISPTFAGALLLLIGVLGILNRSGAFPFCHSAINWHFNSLLGILGCMVQACVSLGLDPLQHIYAIEAFPLAKRTTSLVFVTCVEHLVHIFFITTFLSLSMFSSMWFSFVICAGGFWLFKKLPETRGMTLRQCQSKFNIERSHISPISNVLL